MNTDVTTLSIDALRRLLDLTGGRLAGLYTELRAEARSELDRRDRTGKAPSC